MLLGSCLVVWCKGQGTKGCLPCLCWGVILNWCSDQRGIRAEGPAASSNAVIQGTARVLLLSVLINDLSLWPLPRVLTSTSPEQAPAQTQSAYTHKSMWTHTHNIACLYVGVHIQSCSLVLMSGFLKKKQGSSSVWIQKKKARATLLAIAGGTGANTCALSFTFIILRWPLKLNIDDLKCTRCRAFVGKWNKHRTAYSTCSLILSLVSTISAYCYLISGSSNKSDSFAPMLSACISGAKEHKAACQSGCQRALFEIIEASRMGHGSGNCTAGVTLKFSAPPSLEGMPNNLQGIFKFFLISSSPWIILHIYCITLILPLVYCIFILCVCS